ncbi:ADP-ribose pyrophosphatase YjhB (NUDIX family) [Motilibacter peucedani]|uniref:ADP-ribose pyrophosphatase YjhB (NUDIX family) n=1 Tax=Motilibacter peucedani TaxID=598650 RepID=A0A420XPP5_9ACTN|nr:NUDIX hydrolase N-terminal domain-containing protein [Motilibacter peucedani]RKS75237.1 ADP-ribose pyrophosphatase YjhB (NUDIX family) [Motilibacter peucedani]
MAAPEGPASGPHGELDAGEAVRRAVVELAAIAQTGLHYNRDVFDRARYAQVADVAEALRALVTPGPMEELAPLVDPDGGHATPKVDVRGVVFDDRDRVLLVRERSDGLWTPPGGWCDPLEPPTRSALREISEEAGVEARALRLAALLDRDTRGHEPRMPVTVYKLFFVCEVLDRGTGTRDAKEILDVGWFAMDQLPPLSLARVSREELEICHRSWLDPSLPTVVD